MADDATGEELDDGKAPDSQTDENAQTKAGEGTKTDEQKDGQETLSAYGDLADSLEDSAHKDYAKRFNSFDDLVKGALALRKDISKRPKVPGKDASDDEVADYRKQVGVPETAEKYDVKWPENYEPNDFANDLIGKLQDGAFANNIPAPALQSFVDSYLTLEADMVEAKETETLKAHGESVEVLRKEWGADFERNVQMSKRASDLFGGEELASAMDTIMVGTMRIGDHPALIRAFANIGQRMGEDGILTPVTKGDRKSLQERIDALYKKAPPGSAEYKDPAVQKEIQDLFTQLHGNTAIVGREGRAA